MIYFSLCINFVCYQTGGNCEACSYLSTRKQKSIACKRKCAPYGCTHNMRAHDLCMMHSCTNKYARWNTLKFRLDGTTLNGRNETCC